MKTFLAILSLAMGVVITATGQNPKLNPLNYSGKMYVSAMEVINTPRYVSYEDHAILSSEMTVPVVEVTMAQFDFANKVMILDGKETKFSKAYVKEYKSEYYATYVIYIEPLGEGDKFELVWPENEDPYLLQITPNETSVAICKMKLSHRPVAASGEDALMQLLNSLGDF